MKPTGPNFLRCGWQAGALLGCLLLAAPAIAAPDKSADTPPPNRTDSLDSIPRGGRPISRTDAGNRQRRAGLTALIPCPGTLDALGGGCPVGVGFDPSDLALTARQRPTLWISLPAATQPQRQGELVLLAGDEIVHQQRFDLPAEAGAIPVPIRHDLVPGRDYWWVFSELRSHYHPTRNPTVEGIIRYEPSAATVTRSWYDELDTLARRRLAGDTTDLARSWTQLLQAAGLAAAADAPLLERRHLEPVAYQD